MSEKSKIQNGFMRPYQIMQVSMYTKYLQNMSLVNERVPLTARLLRGSFQHVPKNVQMNIIPTRVSLPTEFCGQPSLGNVDYVASLFAMICNGHEPSKI